MTFSGMAGMGMDPMAMASGMFNNFGGPGMMNGMNMGLGFDAGQGAMGGGFNGQPQGAWNTSGQNKFNQNGYMGGSYNANAGYGTGYNMPPHQGNFNHVHHANYPQNDFHQHGHHNQGSFRGRGRGRGSYPYASRGRGNFQQVNQSYNVNHDSSQQVPQGPVRRGSPVYTPMNGEKEEPKSAENNNNPDRARDEFAPGDAEDRAEEETASTAQIGDVKVEAQPDNESNEAVKVEEMGEADQPNDDLDASNTASVDGVPSNAASSIQVETAPSQTGYATSAMPPPPSPSVSNGLARTSGHSFAEIEAYNTASALHEQGQSLHGRGFTRIPQGEIAAITRLQQPEKPSFPPTEPKGLGVVGAPTGPKAMRQKSFNPATKQDPGFSIFGRAAAARTNTDGTQARHVSPPSIYASRILTVPSSHRSRSRSRSPDEHSSSRNHRHHDRSISPPKADQPDERRERHKRHSRKHEDGYEDEGDYKRSKPERTRESSIESSKRSSRRSHRDRDYEKDKSRRSGRSHRHEESDTDDKYHKKSHRHTYDRDNKDAGTSSKLHRSSHHHRSHDKDEDDPTSSSSSKRRRSRDEYEDDLDDTEREHHSSRHHRSSKRSKHTSTAETQASSSQRRPSSSSAAPFAPPSGPSSFSIPTGPRASQPSSKPDSHALEREKRDRERQMKELQRRALVHPSGSSSRRQSDSRKPSEGGAGDDGGGGEGEIRINGAAARRGSRKITVRYEDELEGLGR